MSVEMFIKWPGGIVYLGVITKEFLEEYCIIIGKLIYGNVDVALLWLRLIAKYLIKEYNLKISRADSCIFYDKSDNGKLEFVMSVHLYDIFMAGKTDRLEIIKDMINLKFNIHKSGKVKKFLGVCYEWVCNAKGLYANITV